MKTAAMFFVNGFEETEAIAPADILRRGGVSLDTVSLTGDKKVTGSHNIAAETDLLFGDIKDKAYDMLILPGGPGTKNYLEHEAFLSYIKDAYANGARIAAICAAPAVLAKLGLLDGKKATVFPGMEKEMAGAVLTETPAITDGNITTGRAAGAALDFGFELLAALCGEDVKNEIMGKMVYKP